MVIPQSLSFAKCQTTSASVGFARRRSAGRAQPFLYPSPSAAWYAAAARAPHNQPRGRLSAGASAHAAICGYRELRIRDCDCLCVVRKKKNSKNSQQDKVLATHMVEMQSSLAPYYARAPCLTHTCSIKYYNPFCNLSLPSVKSAFQPLRARGKILQ